MLLVADEKPPLELSREEEPDDDADTWPLACTCMLAVAWWEEGKQEQGSRDLDPGTTTWPTTHPTTTPMTTATEMPTRVKISHRLDYPFGFGGRWASAGGQQTLRRQAGTFRQDSARSRGWNEAGCTASGAFYGGVFTSG